MNNKFDEAIEDLKANIFPELKEILVVYLYGSVARKDYSPRHSDLDLFIVLNKKKVTEKLKERLDSKILSLQHQYGIKVHPEYQSLEISKEDQSLIRKMIEEGKIIYSAGSFSFDFQQIGLRQFVIYEYSVGKGQTMFSKVLHGRKSWYYKKKEKVIKEYPGIIDGENILSLGNGFLMVLRSKEKELKNIFDNFKIEYKLKKIIYA
ncbi:MAG: nucleotidyltransferase domain-containing protein [Candidatus Woesearchaeota archaeon]